MSAYSLIPLAGAQDARRTGGKASNLARLIALGQPVPTGYVITDAILSAVLAECGLENDDDVGKIRPALEGAYAQRHPVVLFVGGSPVP